MHIRDLRRKLLWSLLFGVAVGFALALYGDVHRLGALLARFDARYLPLLLGLTMINYTLRFLKWQYYLRVIGAAVPWQRSLAIFVAGLAMVMTPGKAGELLKSYLLKVSNGTPMARSAPIVLAERLTDGLAMFLLAGAGLFTFRNQGMVFWIAVGVAAAMLAFVVASRWRALVLWALSRWGRLPVVGRFERHLHAAYDSTYDLLAPSRFFLAVGAGVISWGAECLALYFALRALGVPPGWHLLLSSLFTLAVSTLLGAVSFLPGGLGATDISLTGFLEALLGLSTDVAVAATLIIRVATLWFGVGLGLIVLSALLRQLHLDQDAVLSPSNTADDPLVTNPPRLTEANRHV